MEAFKNWLNDKKNLPIVLGALAGILIVAFLLIRAMSGGAPEPTPATDATTPMAAPGSPGSPPKGMMPPVSPGSGGAPGAVPPGPSPGTGGASGTAVASAAGASGGKQKPEPLEEYRDDPFQLYWGPKPHRTKMTFTAKLTKPDIRKISPIKIEVEQEDVLPPQPERRMAGIMKNGRVFAIIESEGKATIVKPGQTLDEYVAVDRILPDKVILRSIKTKKPVFIEVPKSVGRITAKPAPTTTAPAPRAPGYTPPPPPRGRAPGPNTLGPEP